MPMTELLTAVLKAGPLTLIQVLNLSGVYKQCHLLLKHGRVCMTTVLSVYLKEIQECELDGIFITTVQIKLSYTIKDKALLP